MKIKNLMLVMGCAVLLCGCTKSNIVQPEETQGPDFNLYMDVELDMDQLHADVEDIYLDEDEYPMAAGIDFELNLEEEYVAVDVIVKDGTTPEDAAYFADVAIKGINDEVAIQDFSYGESGEDTFGGLYQDNEIRLAIYEESVYAADGEPMYETTVEKDAYVTFEIE